MPRGANGSGNEAFLPLPPTPWGKRECKPLTVSPMAYGHRCKQGRTGLGRPLKMVRFARYHHRAQWAKKWLEVDRVETTGDARPDCSDEKWLDAWCVRGG